MDTNIQVLLAVFAFAGIVCGIFLTYSNREEMKEAKRYLLLSQKVLFSASLLLTAYLLDLCCASILVAAFIAVFLFIARKRIPSVIVYPVLGLLTYISAEVPKAFLSNISLVFVFGIPTGTLIMFENRYNKRKVLLETAKNLGFFVCIILILFPVF